MSLLHFYSKDAPLPLRNVWLSVAQRHAKDLVSMVKTTQGCSFSYELFRYCTFLKDDLYKRQRKVSMHHLTCFRGLSNHRVFPQLLRAELGHLCFALKLIKTLTFTAKGHVRLLFRQLSSNKTDRKRSGFNHLRQFLGEILNSRGGCSG